jgi:hypothetical protein
MANKKKTSKRSSSPKKAAARKPSPKKSTLKKVAAKKKRTAPKKSNKKKTAPAKKVAAPKSAPKKAAATKKAAAKQPSSKKVRAPEKVQSLDSSGIERSLLRSRAGIQSGDLQGLSRRVSAASESVDELLEEGNAFEAGVVGGIEQADDSDEEVLAHEVSEDDVPGEYLDKD